MSLQLSDTAPDFTTESTEGMIHFHDWIGDGRAIRGTATFQATLTRRSSSHWKTVHLDTNPTNMNRTILAYPPFKSTAHSPQALPKPGVFPSLPS